MKTGVIDPKKEIIELPIYEIKGLCDEIAKAAASKKEEWAKTNAEYKEKITRFDPNIEFCLHELGWMLYNPFLSDQEEVIFSNGKRCYLASLNYVMREDFDRKAVVNPEIGFGRLYDDEIGYVKTPTSDSILNEGIVDGKGYVDASFTEGIEQLASIENLYNMMDDEMSYSEYIKERENYSSTLDYITSKPNVISAKKNSDGNISLGYVSENDGAVQEFIDMVAKEGRLSELIPAVSDLNTSIVKAGR